MQVETISYTPGLGSGLDLGYQILTDMRNIQRRGGELLGHIVVGSRVQTLHPVFDAAALGQHQHRQAGPLQPQMPQHAHAIQLGQVQVEDYQVIIKLASHGARLLPIFHHVHRVVFPNQPLAHESSQSLVIFRN